MAGPRGEPKNEPPFVRERGSLPAPPPARPSLLAGKGLMTAQDASAAIGLGASWVAMQADTEGGPISPDRLAPAVVLAWEARPSDPAAQVERLGATGYIGQAENPPEFRACLALGRLPFPHYLVGKPDGWGDTPEEIEEAMAEARSLGWGLLIEWYWNEQPNLVNGPDSKGYPVDACLFGSYPVGDRYVTIPQYRAVWRGSFGCYLPEEMPLGDRDAFVLARA